MGVGDLSSVMRFAHDCSFCGRSQGGISTLRRRWLEGRGGSVSRRDHNQAVRNRATLQAEPTKKKGTRQTPAALRERGAGGEALLSEKRPLPQKHSLHHNRSLGQLSGEGDGELGENVLVHVEVAVGDDLEGDLRWIFTVQHASRHAAGLLA